MVGPAHGGAASARAAVGTSTTASARTSMTR